MIFINQTFKRNICYSKKQNLIVYQVSYLEIFLITLVLSVKSQHSLLNLQEKVMSKIPVTIYAEMTPNPAVMKFVANNYLIDPSKQVEFTSISEAKGYSPLAEQLFQFPFVKSVFIASNFVSVTKNEALSWDYVLQDLRDYIRNYIADGNEIVVRIPEPNEVVQKNENGEESKNASIPASEYDDAIINLLEEHVKPAVEGDGGAIEFRHFQDGIVTVLLKGACSGCPSSTATLKHGIENLLKAHLPEVKEVVAEQG